MRKLGPAKTQDPRLDLVALNIDFERIERQGLFRFMGEDSVPRDVLAIRFIPVKLHN